METVSYGIAVHPSKHRTHLVQLLQTVRHRLLLANRLHRRLQFRPRSVAVAVGCGCGLLRGLGGAGCVWIKIKIRIPCDRSLIRHGIARFSLTLEILDDQPTRGDVAIVRGG